tara:strand:- start:228 stop:812 length:585 start_codon:yes stop_codon:yes gene_type:complete
MHVVCEDLILVLATHCSACDLSKLQQTNRNICAAVKHDNAAAWRAWAGAVTCDEAAILLRGSIIQGYCAITHWLLEALDERGEEISSLIATPPGGGRPLFSFALYTNDTHEALRLLALVNADDLFTALLGRIQDGDLKSVEYMLTGVAPALEPGQCQQILQTAYDAVKMCPHYHPRYSKLEHQQVLSVVFQAVY